MMDPPDHTRLRKLVSRSFTQRRTDELPPRVEETSGTLLDALPTDRPVDLMDAYAAPLPIQVMCELIGVPVADRAAFTEWSRVMVDQPTPEETMAGSDNLATYFGELVERKRREPDDALLSALTEVADDGDRLSRDELVGMGMLLIAGHETTINLIGNGLLGLLTHPDQRALLRERPDLMAGLVEEVLRWDSPVQNASARFTTEAVDLGGVTIPAAAQVVLSLAAANRDPDRFPTPTSCASTATRRDTCPSTTACTTASGRSSRGSRGRRR